MQIPIISGIYTDGGPDFRTMYPRNMVPVPKAQGISAGYLRPADGIRKICTPPGNDRGGINWNGAHYRVSGTKFIRVAKDGSCAVIGDVGAGGQVSMDYGFDQLAIASGGSLYLWDGSTLTQVTDTDLGVALDVHWIAGYFMTTDGTSIVVTDLNNPTSVNPLHYGSAESDPDPVLAVDELRNEAYAFGRYTIQPYQNVGGTGFPFQTIESALIPKGILGTHAYCALGNTYMFTGSGRGEAPAVYMVIPGDTQKLSTREIDTILLGYTEAELSTVVMETRVDKSHQHVLIHLPDQTLVYDTIGSQVVGQPLWHTLTSSVQGLGQYRARGLVWCYDQWNVGDPSSPAIGALTDEVSTHYGDAIGWEFGAMALYNEGDGAIVHELELVCLSGRVDLGADPVVWTSYSLDGEVWSQERSTRAGRQGQRAQRICWRSQGRMLQMRMQKFRGTSDSRLSVARLEMRLEPLFTRPGNG